MSINTLALSKLSWKQLSSLTCMWPIDKKDFKTSLAFSELHISLYNINIKLCWTFFVGFVIISSKMFSIEISYSWSDEKARIELVAKSRMANTDEFLKFCNIGRYQEAALKEKNKQKYSKYSWISLIRISIIRIFLIFEWIQSHRPITLRNSL